MRLKKVFAGALAAAMLVCAVAVPAFAAEEVEQENCLSSSYVQMNIPTLSLPHIPAPVPAWQKPPRRLLMVLP